MRCKFCQPSDEYGTHSVAEFNNLGKDEQRVIMDVYGGYITVGFAFAADEETTTLRQRIEYCPICGRKYGEGERNEAV